MTPRGTARLRAYPKSSEHVAITGRPLRIADEPHRPLLRCDLAPVGLHCIRGCATPKNASQSDTKNSPSPPPQACLRYGGFGRIMCDGNSSLPSPGRAMAVVPSSCRRYSSHGEGGGDEDQACDPRPATRDKNNTNRRRFAERLVTVRRCSTGDFVAPLRAAADLAREQIATLEDAACRKAWEMVVQTREIHARLCDAHGRLEHLQLDIREQTGEVRLRRCRCRSPTSSSASCAASC